MLKNRGIALLQVLLITGIISILALYLSSTAREQVKLAQLATERAEAILAIKTAQSRLLMTILTQFREPNVNTADDISSQWNFYGVPFLLKNEVSASIQDQNGLISIGFPDPQLIKDILDQNGADSTLAPVITDSLLDWQDADRLTRINGAEQGSYELGPRNANISLQQEVSQIRGMSADMWQKFSAIFTLYRRGPFNPMAAPPEILSGFIGRDRAAEYLAQRKSAPITATSFSAMTGLQESMEQIFYPGRVMEITLRARRGEVILNKTMMLELDPYAVGNQSPVDVLEVIWD
ncbi:MAG: general secretion pathway protein K [Paraglaciecola sp.]